jgi:hypothetical protein
VRAVLVLENPLITTIDVALDVRIETSLRSMVPIYMVSDLSLTCSADVDFGHVAVGKRVS